MGEANGWGQMTITFDHIWNINVISYVRTSDMAMIYTLTGFENDCFKGKIVKN